MDGERGLREPLEFREHADRVLDLFFRPRDPMGTDIGSCSLLLNLRTRDVSAEGDGEGPENGRPRKVAGDSRIDDIGERRATFTSAPRCLS